METVANQIGTPAAPVRTGERLAVFPIRGGRALPDRRVGAIAEWGCAGALELVARTVVHFYERADGRRLIAAVIDVPSPDPPARDPQTA